MIDSVGSGEPTVATRDASPVLLDRRQTDRRHQQIPVLVDRRHGDRRAYQRGCRCTPCRAANAAYWAQWRASRLAGRPLPGQRVPASRTHILMKVLVIEGFTKSDLARLLGWHGNYARVHDAPVITLRTAARVRRLYQERVAG